MGDLLEVRKIKVLLFIGPTSLIKGLNYILYGRVVYIALRRDLSLINVENLVIVNNIDSVTVSDFPIFGGLDSLIGICTNLVHHIKPI